MFDYKHAAVTYCDKLASTNEQRRSSSYTPFVSMISLLLKHNLSCRPVLCNNKDTMNVQADNYGTNQPQLQLQWFTHVTHICYTQANKWSLHENLGICCLWRCSNL